MNVGDMSATFKLKKNATFQDGTPVTAKDVKWSLDRAVTVGGFPTFQMGAGSLTKPEQFVVVDDNTFRVDFTRKDRLTIPDLAVIVPGDLQLRAGQEERHGKRPVGHGIHQAEHGRQRRLSRRELERRHRSHPGAQRQVGRRPAAEDQAHRLAHGAVRRQPPRAAGARRRRHLLRAAEQGLRRAARDAGKLSIVSTPFSQRHPVPRHERHQAAVRQSQGPPGGGLRRSPTRRSWTRCCSGCPSRCSARRPTSRPRSPGRSRTSSTPTSPRPSS